MPPPSCPLPFRSAIRCRTAARAADAGRGCAAAPPRARQAAAYLKRGADVETASLSFDSKTGVRCKGIFDVTAYHPLPSGQWGITATGIWSPEKEFAEYLPSLLRMAGRVR